MSHVCLKSLWDLDSGSYVDGMLGINATHCCQIADRWNMLDLQQQQQQQQTHQTLDNSTVKYTCHLAQRIKITRWYWGYTHPCVWCDRPARVTPGSLKVYEQRQNLSSRGQPIGYFYHQLQAPQSWKNGFRPQGQFCWVLRSRKIDDEEWEWVWERDRAWCTLNRSNITTTHTNVTYTGMTLYSMYAQKQT